MKILDRLKIIIISLKLPSEALDEATEEIELIRLYYLYRRNTRPNISKPSITKRIKGKITKSKERDPIVLDWD